MKDSSTADADFKIEDASPFSKGDDSDLKKKRGGNFIRYQGYNVGQLCWTMSMSVV